MLVLSGADVRSYLTTQLAYGAVHAAMTALDAPETYQPLRSVARPPGVAGTMLLKPAAVAGSLGVKVVSVFPGNGGPLPSVQGFVLLLDPASGQTLALIDASALTELRTAAASAVATQALARPDATRLGLLGSGAQARSHLLAIAAQRELTEIRVSSPTNADAFVSWAREQGLIVKACTAEELARASDIICTVTSSTSPVLRGSWIAPGTHVNAVGAFQPEARELDTEAVVRSRVVVDSLESASAEAGCLLIPEREGLDPIERVTLTAVLADPELGRRTNEEVTLFSSTGLAIQDIAVAAALLEVATSRGRGTVIDLA